MVFKAYRAAFKLIYNGCQDPVIHLVQPVLIYVKGIQGIFGNSGINVPIAFIWAKSRVRRSRALAIRGVPRLRRAIS
jgi:hypothetical protein